MDQDYAGPVPLGLRAMPVKSLPAKLNKYLLVLGMRYSVTVSAARLMMPELYRRLFDGKGLDEAIQGTRRLLYDDKNRRAYFRETIKLEDWILPVVYQHRRTDVKLRPFTNEEWAAWLKADVAVHKGPDPAYQRKGLAMVSLK
jgi:hypothetical protein